MTDLKQSPPDKKKRVCGNCEYYKLQTLEDMHHPWRGVWVCKSEDANPHKKDPKNGEMHFYRKPCKYWEW